MTREQMVLNALKPKVKAFGFNQKELKGIAARIAGNLTSTEEASVEDVNAEIDTQIDAVIPFLQFAQSQSNRVIEEWRKNHPEFKEEDDDDDDDTQPVITKSKSSKKNPAPKNEENEMFKKVLEEMASLRGEISDLKNEKKSTTRKDRLDNLLKDTGIFGSRTLKSFSKMNFESDEDFEEFYEEVQADLESYNQERANNGLAKLGKVPQTKGTTEKIEVLTDDEIKQLANL